MFNQYSVQHTNIEMLNELNRAQQRVIARQRQEIKDLQERLELYFRLVDMLNGVIAIRSNRNAGE